MQCTDLRLSSQATYLQKLALCNISYEIGLTCGDHRFIVEQIAAFCSLFDSKSVGDSAHHPIGDMPFTLARYLQNQIDVKSVLQHISPMEYAMQTEFMHVALSVCFAKALKLGRDSRTGETRLTTVAKTLSNDVDASANPNRQTWLKNLHETAQKDEAIITNFIMTQMESHANSSFPIKALGYIMISSGCCGTLPQDIVVQIMSASDEIGGKILALFAVEKDARELYDQDLKKQTVSYGNHPEVVPVTCVLVPEVGSVTGVLVPEVGVSVIPIGVIVNTERPVDTPFDARNTEGGLADFV